MAVSDVLEKLDRTLATLQMPMATNCGLCSKPLTGDEASLDFCSSMCQYAWHWDRANGYMSDGGRMASVLGGCSYDANCRCPARNNHMAPAEAEQDRQRRLLAVLGRLRQSGSRTLQEVAARQAAAHSWGAQRLQPGVDRPHGPIREW